MNAEGGILTRCYWATKACTRCRCLGDLHNEIESLRQVMRVPPVPSITVSGGVLRRVYSCVNVCASLQRNRKPASVSVSVTTQQSLARLLWQRQTLQRNIRTANNSYIKRQVQGLRLRQPAGRVKHSCLSQHSFLSEQTCKVSPRKARWSRVIRPNSMLDFLTSVFYELEGLCNSQQMQMWGINYQIICSEVWGASQR